MRDRALPREPRRRLRLLRADEHWRRVRILRPAARLVQRHIEDLVLRAHARDRVRSVTLYMVYRQRNASVVHHILEAPIAHGWAINLWALDEIAETLATFTRGVGKGSKFALYNELLQAAPPGDADVVVFSDDDFRFRRGDLQRFVALMSIVGLDVAQPVHATSRNAFHDITLRRGSALARLTGFVEIGPVVAFSPRARATVVPFPNDAGMGWGLEFEWAQLAGAGQRLGTVDAVAIDHLVPPGTEYDGADAWYEMERRLARAGIPLTEWRGETTSIWPAYAVLRPRAWRRAEPTLPDQIRARPREPQ